MRYVFSISSVVCLLQVYENGLEEGEFVYYFNVREATRGVGDKEKLLQRVRAHACFSFCADFLHHRLCCLATVAIGLQ